MAASRRLIRYRRSGSDVHFHRTEVVIEPIKRLVALRTENKWIRQMPCHVQLKPPLYGPSPFSILWIDCCSSDMTNMFWRNSWVRSQSRIYCGRLKISLRNPSARDLSATTNSDKSGITICPSIHYQSKVHRKRYRHGGSFDMTYVEK